MFIQNIGTHFLDCWYYVLEDHNNLSFIMSPNRNESVVYTEIEVMLLSCDLFPFPSCMYL
jgi:hypothetical protein